MLNSIGGAVEVLEGVLEDMSEEDSADHKRSMHMAAIETVIKCLNDIDHELHEKKIDSR